MEKYQLNPTENELMVLKVIVELAAGEYSASEIIRGLNEKLRDGDYVTLDE